VASAAFHKDPGAITAVANQKGIGFYELLSIRVGRPGTQLGRGDGDVDGVTCCSNLCIARKTCLGKAEENWS